MSLKFNVVKLKKKKIDIAKIQLKQLFGEVLSEEEKKMIQVYENKSREKKKVVVIRKLKPINYIKEDLGNGIELKFFNYSGHCGVYKNSSLLGFITETTNSVPKEWFDNCSSAWLMCNNGDKIILKPDENESLYETMYKSLRRMPTDKRKTVSVVRWDIPHGKMPKHKNILL